MGRDGVSLGIAETRWASTARHCGPQFSQAFWDHGGIGAGVQDDLRLRGNLLVAGVVAPLGRAPSTLEPHGPHRIVLILVLVLVLGRQGVLGDVVHHTARNTGRGHHSHTAHGSRLLLGRRRRSREGTRRRRGQRRRARQWGWRLLLGHLLNFAAAFAFALLGLRSAISGKMPGFSAIPTLTFRLCLGLGGGVGLATFLASFPFSGRPCPSCPCPSCPWRRAPRGPRPWGRRCPGQ